MMKQAEPSDDALAALAARGDRQAFARLLERHYDAVHRIAWRWCGDAGEAEDIAQDVCIKLARAVRQFRGDAAFSSWLYRIVLNAVRDRQRAVSKERERVAAYAAHALVEAQPDMADELGEWLWDAVARLPERQRDAVLLVHGEGMSHDKAAEVLGVSGGTVSFHIHEARKKLKAMMSPEDEVS